MNFLFILLLLLTAEFLPAENITTIDGVEYKNVWGLVAKPDGLQFMTEEGRKFIAFPELSAEIQKKYQYNPYDANISAGMMDRKGMLQKSQAFSLSQLGEAQKTALKENKPLGFIMMWDDFYNKSTSPLVQGSSSASLHFYNSFHDSMVLVFVSHERELGLVPESVKKGFFGPDEGGFAPNMCVVSADLKDYIVEIPYGGNNSNGEIRHAIFLEKVKAVKNYFLNKSDGR